MKRSICKRIISLILITYFACNIIYAKPNPFETEVSEPVGEQKNIKSDGAIISNNPYKEYTPINPVKPGVDLNEYESVNNYNIDIKTLDSRIKYFSPTYLNIKEGAQSMYWMAYYARGGNDTLVYNYKEYTTEILDAVNMYKNLKNSYIMQRNHLKKDDPDYETKYEDLSTQIATYTGMYNNVLGTYNMTNRTITGTKSALGLSRALYNIGNIDNNNQVAYARRMVTKSLSSVVLTYMQLNTYVDILEKQTNLYYDMYLLKKKNYELGIATALDVSTSLDNYETSKNTYKSTQNTLNNVKEQVAINLGYKISDIDKLVFVEPEVDLLYIDSINFENDKERTYTSNSSYTSLKISDKDRKFPQSTGEDLLNKRQEYTANKIMTEFENIYANLRAKRIAYESSMYLLEICDINEKANKRKFDNKLVSELEYKGLELQNLANKLQVKIAKYDLINASNDYYYATLGNITIS